MGKNRGTHLGLLKFMRGDHGQPIITFSTFNNDYKSNFYFKSKRVYMTRPRVSHEQAVMVDLTYPANSQLRKAGVPRPVAPFANMD